MVEQWFGDLTDLCEHMGPSSLNLPTNTKFKNVGVGSITEYPSSRVHIYIYIRLLDVPAYLFTFIYLFCLCIYIWGQYVSLGGGVGLVIGGGVRMTLNPKP